MRKLNRPMPGPSCISNYNYNAQKWKGRVPSQKCKMDIWRKLQVMQNGFCVYCESVAVKGNGHIEHFRHKGQKPDGTTPFRHLTFEWENLFGCCGSDNGNTCGHHKDREGVNGPGEYDPNYLIQPDEDDPIHFFNFLDTGLIEAKVGLSVEETKKATETIRVLNLGALNGARKKQIDIFKNELKILEEISHGLDEQELFQEMNNIKNKVQQQEYQTAVLDALF